MLFTVKHSSFHSVRAFSKLKGVGSMLNDYYYELLPNGRFPGRFQHTHSSAIRTNSEWTGNYYHSWVGPVVILLHKKRIYRKRIQLNVSVKGNILKGTTSLFLPFLVFCLWILPIYEFIQNSLPPHLQWEAKYNILFYHFIIMKRSKLN